MLASRFAQTGLTLVDIGGRRSVVRELRLLAPFAHYVTCEPDRDEAARLADAHRHAWHQFTVVPAAIGGSIGDAPMYVTKKAGMSSLLEPDPAVVQRFVRSDRFEVIGSVRVPTLTLDAAAAAHAFTDACFLKLDTQGTELDILRSGPDVMRTVVGVSVEMAFRPFYRGQPVFGEVDAFLRALGFELFQLERTNVRHAPAHLDLVSERVTTYAHALYFREAASSDAAGRVRLLALLLAYRYFDLAFAIACPDERQDVQQLAELATREVRDREDAERFFVKVVRDRAEA